MPDLDHVWGSDLSFGPTGDLATASGLEFGRQRILRRLLTNAGDYLWQSTYGAGLPAWIGQPASIDQITGLIRTQMAAEPAVTLADEPDIAVSAIANGLSASITYTDAGTEQSVSLSFDLSS